MERSRHEADYDDVGVGVRQGFDQCARHGEQLGVESVQPQLLGEFQCPRLCGSGMDDDQVPNGVRHRARS
jgi:hypothetical protein